MPCLGFFSIEEFMQALAGFDVVAQLPTRSTITLETYAVCTYTQTMDYAWDRGKAERKEVRQYYQGLSL